MAKRGASKQPKRNKKTIREVVETVQGNLNNLTVSDLQSVQRFKALQAEMKAKIEAALGDKHSYRRSELAELFGVDERTISRWSKKGKLPQSSRGIWDIRRVLRVLHEQLEGIGRDGTPDDRLKTVKALREELRLAQDKDAVIDREAFLREASVRLTAARDRASGWAERFVRLFPADQRNEALALLRTEIRDFLKMITGALNPDRGSA